MERTTSPASDHSSAPAAPAVAPASARAGKARTAIYLGILVVLAVVPYLNSLRNDFVYDDFYQVLGNPYLRDFHHLREIFTSSVWSFMGDFRGSTNYYRPLMSLGYLACYQLCGPRALGFHAANLLANLGVVLLIFLVTRRLFGSAGVALASACVFALHPIHTEAVDWIAAVTELELALFYLLTFWCFLASARAAGKTSIPLQIAMAASFACALLSKEQALTLSAVATVYEHYFRDDRAATSKIQKVQRYGSLWLLAVVYLVARSRYLGGLAPSLGRPNWGTDDVVAAALALVGRYGWKLVWPARLCAYYVLPDDATALYPWALGGVLALGILVAAFVVLRRFDRQAAFGIVWFLAVLAPVLNVRWLASNAFTERYLYLASAGPVWIVGWAGVRAWNALATRGRRARFLLPLAAVLIGAVAVERIVARNREWHDNVTFYTATLAVSPAAHYIHNNLGSVYWEAGNHDAAEKEWRTALRLAPDNEYVLRNLGLAANTRKDYAEAERLLRRALEIRPDYSDAHSELGVTLAATGRFEEAEAQLRTAERLSPYTVRVHNLLSEFYFDRQRLDEAEAEARRSVEIVPTTQGDWDLGLVRWLKGDRTSAEHAFRNAAALNPADSRAYFMLGLLYMDWGRNPEAIRAYRQGLQLDPTNAEAAANLKKLEFLAQP
jgi:Flp pilus assembly protein TadD